MAIGIRMLMMVLTELRERRLEHDVREAAEVIRRVDRMLSVWAEHWGEPPALVKEKLLEALKR
jgi:hypothetical protein